MKLPSKRSRVETRPPRVSATRAAPADRGGPRRRSREPGQRSPVGVCRRAGRHPSRRRCRGCGRASGSRPPVLAVEPVGVDGLRCPGPALGLVTVEQSRPRPALQHRRQLPGQVVGGLDEVFIPKAPAGVTRWAASPARKTRPCRNWSASSVARSTRRRPGSRAQSRSAAHAGRVAAALRRGILELGCEQAPTVGGRRRFETGRAPAAGDDGPRRGWLGRRPGRSKDRRRRGCSARDSGGRVRASRCRVGHGPCCGRRRPDHVGGADQSLGVARPFPQPRRHAGVSWLSMVNSMPRRTSPSRWPTTSSCLRGSSTLTLSA